MFFGWPQRVGKPQKFFCVPVFCFPAFLPLAILIRDVIYKENHDTHRDSAMILRKVERAVS